MKSRIALALCAASLLAGGATLAPDGGVGRVSSLVAERNIAATIPPIERDPPAERVAALLEQPLTAERAVEMERIGTLGELAEVASAQRDADRDVGVHRTNAFDLARVDIARIVRLPLLVPCMQVNEVGSAVDAAEHIRDDLVRRDRHVRGHPLVRDHAGRAEVDDHAFVALSCGKLSHRAPFHVVRSATRWASSSRSRKPR